jgi:hypothetical protein
MLGDTKANFMMRDYILGTTLEVLPGELDALADTVRQGRLIAQRVDQQSDGDVRYWDVETSQSEVLRRLKEFGEQCFKNRTKEPPRRSFIMINRIDAERCPNGSGGGWHRDSFRRQYKAFTYLTRVESESQGPFCFIPASNSPPFRLISALHRLITGANRYSDLGIRRFVTWWCIPQAVIVNPGIPFFVDSSLIHRGLPISDGERIMAALYILAKDDRSDF